MKEPKVPRYSQLMTQLCLRLKITAWSENEALAVARSFMPNHAAIAQTAMNGIHTSPAFCSHICLTSAPRAQVCGSPPSAPNTPAVITTGTMNCASDTPRLPSPAFSPSAVPFCALGKKKLMLAMLEAKLPPPKPHSSASSTKVEELVAGSLTARTKPIVGTRNEEREKAAQSRRPAPGT